MLHAVGVGNAGVAFAGSAKGVAGDDGHMLLFQQLRAEILTAHARALDAGEGVERTARLKAGQAHIVKGLHHKAAAHIVLVAHAVDLAIALLQGGDGGVLAGGGGTHDSTLVDLGHDPDDGCRAAGIAQTPAGHGVSLGEAVHHDGALGHAGQGGNGNMRPQAVVQLGVDLIGEHHDVGAAQHLSYRFQILALHHRTGGVVGKRHDEQLCLGGDGCFQRIGTQAELVLLTAGHMHRHTAGQGGDGLVAHKAGLRDDDLVPGLHQRADAHINGFAAAHRDEHLVQRVVVQAHAALQILCHLGAQLLQACVGGVAGAAMLQTLNAGFAHGPWRFEVRLAHAQTDALGHFGSQIEKFADAGGAHGLSGRRDQFIVVHHSTVHSLSSISSS